MLFSVSNAIKLMEDIQPNILLQRNIAINIWAERQMPGNERAETLENLREAVFKIDSSIHKNRAKTITEININSEQLLVKIYNAGKQYNCI